MLKDYLESIRDCKPCIVRYEGNSAIESKVILRCAKEMQRKGARHAGDHCVIHTTAPKEMH